MYSEPTIQNSQSALQKQNASWVSSAKLKTCTSTRWVLTAITQNFPRIFSNQRYASRSSFPFLYLGKHGQNVQRFFCLPESEHSLPHNNLRYTESRHVFRTKTVSFSIPALTMTFQHSHSGSTAQHLILQTLYYEKKHLLFIIASDGGKKPNPSVAKEALSCRYNTVSCIT